MRSAKEITAISHTIRRQQPNSRHLAAVDDITAAAEAARETVDGITALAADAATRLM
jgi:hypothetical protein